jgi:molybdopterin-guanine dinucleotide biosynthesis adapter protein
MIIGIYGYQDTGKTRLAEEVIRALTKKGYSVSSVKHTSHRTSVDSEGKDTWRHWSAGSDPVVFSSGSETTIIKHSKMPIEKIAEMVKREFNPDVIIIEGYKDGPFPKVAVGEIAPKKGTVLSNPSPKRLLDYLEKEVAVERVRAILPGMDCGTCGLDCEELARAIVSGKKSLKDCTELPDTGVKIIVGGEQLAMTKFPASFVDDTIRGMLSSLKGYVPGKEVEIRLEPKSEATRKSAKK